MNTREYYSECFRSEKPRFVRVIRAVPPDRLDYKPHPRSTSAGDIVWLLASELADACDVVDQGEGGLRAEARAPKTLEESVAAYERNAAEIEKRLAKLDDAAGTRRRSFLMDGRLAWEAPLGDMLYGFLFDAIHHRGQLSSYLRPMGAKVPSIYGPSADDPGA